MGRIQTYITDLLNEIEKKERAIASEQNEYEKIQKNYELLGLREKLQNAADVLSEVFKDRNIDEVVKDVLGEEEAQNTLNALQERNDNLKQRYVSNYQGVITGAQIRKEQLILQNPTIENEDHPQHSKLVAIDREIANAQDKLDNPTYKQDSIFSVVKKEKYNDFILAFADHYDNKIIVNNSFEYTARIEEFVPVDENEKVLTYPVKDKLTKIAFHINTSAELKQYILDNCDIIDNLTAIDSRESVNKLFNDFAKPVGSKVDANNKKVLIDAAKEKNLDHILNERDGGFDNVNTQEDEQKIYNDDFELKFSNETNLKFCYMIREMENRDIVPLDAKNVEEDNKFYGFRKLMQARNRVVKMVEESSIDTENRFSEEEFKEAVEDLKLQAKNIREMYEIINEEIGTNYSAMPTNVDNYRNTVIPREFKKNLAHNSQFNSLYITKAFLQSHNIDIDDFMKNPAKMLKEAFEKDTKDLDMDSVLKDKHKGEALFDLSVGKQDIFKSVDVYGYVRVVEFVNSMETNPENIKNNNLVVAGMLNKFGKRKASVDLSSNYFAEANKKETIQNIFLAEKDDDGKIPYIDCHSANVVSNIPNNKVPEEFAKSIQSRKTGFNMTDVPTSLDKVADYYGFEEKFYDMMAIIKKFDNVRRNPKNADKVKESKNLTVADLVGAAQELCVKYILTHDIDAMNKAAIAGESDPVVSKEFMKAMINLIENPSKETSLNGIELEGLGNKDLAKLIKNRSSLMSKKANTLKKDAQTKEKGFIDIFKDINKKMDDLDKQVDKIAKKIGKGETNAEIEEIGMRHRRLLNQLMEAQNTRIDELRQEYENGKITKYYYEKRIEQIKDLRPLEEAAMFETDESYMKDFKAYKKYRLEKDPTLLQGEDAEEDLKREFEDKKERANQEKDRFLADRVCADHGIYAKKAFNSENKFAVKSELIQINENDYRQYFDELVQTNDYFKNLRLQEEAKNEELLINNEEVVREQIYVFEADELTAKKEEYKEIGSEEISEVKDRSKDSVIDM